MDNVRLVVPAAVSGGAGESEKSTPEVAVVVNRGLLSATVSDGAVRTWVGGRRESEVLVVLLDEG